MRRSSERDPEGVTAALAEHFCMYCAGAGFIAFALYYSMQPTPDGQSWSRRLQAAATDGRYLCCAIAEGARGDYARCHGGAGAGNSWRIGIGRRLGAPTARREQGQIA